MSDLGDIKNPGPSQKTRRDRIRSLVLWIGLWNFLAFLGHVMADKASPFPGGGRLVNGVYLIAWHGSEISLTPVQFWLGYLHGVVFVVVHLACMLLGWRFRDAQERVSRGT